MSEENTPNIAVCSKCTENITAIGCKTCESHICLPRLGIKTEVINKSISKLTTKCPDCDSDLEYL